MQVTQDIRTYKKELRAKIKSIRADFSAQEKSELDSRICARFLSLSEYKSAELILIYISKDIEVDTAEIIKNALASGKSVAVPKCIPETREMNFYKITSEQQLEVGYYGLREPITEKCVKVTDFSNALCVVPGLAFDKLGYRLGFGMGYYDRFLAGFDGITVGICYKACVIPKQRHGFYDKSVNILVTDKYILNT